MVKIINNKLIRWHRYWYLDIWRIKIIDCIILIDSGIEATCWKNTTTPWRRGWIKLLKRIAMCLSRIHRIRI